MTYQIDANLYPCLLVGTAGCTGQPLAVIKRDCYWPTSHTGVHLYTPGRLHHAQPWRRHRQNPGAAQPNRRGDNDHAPS